MAIATVNPATGVLVKSFEAIAPPVWLAQVERAAAAFEAYRRTTFEQRSAWLYRAADILERDRDRLAALATLEMGKPLGAAIAEVDKCALVCRFYGDRAAAFLADEVIETDAGSSYVTHQPLGAILAVMPWNFPFWQVFRFAAPALMAGNVALLKHASNVPQVALAIEAVWVEAGLPDGAFQTLLVGADQVAAIAADPRIKAATLTGSEPAGASLAMACGAALKKVVLELGGSDPFIVTETADLAAAVRTAVVGRLLNNGQSCIAAKRFILLEAIADEFLDRLKAAFAAVRVGDPMDPAVDLGPLATAAIADELDQQVQGAIAAGAKAIIGGDRAALMAQLPESLRGGSFYPATILTDIPEGCAARQAEFFGPVALTFRVPDFDAAIALANDIPFGLGASCWTHNPAEMHRAIADLEAGSVFINGLVKSDPRLPFGGIKRSGYGRELSRQGIQEFVNIKTVWIA
ncbi:MAG: NAD-dependent succinate-semialdehyde dehydrogenase [Cyanophyceae cyanobacterium]